MWEKYEGNPVIGAAAFNGIIGSFDQTFAFIPFVMEDHGLLRVWYVGLRDNFSVGEGISLDGIRWYLLKDNPVIAPGPPGSFDATGLRGPCVIKDMEGYKMYYYSSSGGRLKIGLATSADGNTWTKHPGNPVLDVGSPEAWDDEGVWAPMVIYDHNTYRMWFQGFGGEFASIGYATSSNGVQWTKYGDNPVLPHGDISDFDYYTAGEPRICIARGRHHLFYTGTSSVFKNEIGYAHSMDGINWMKYGNNPILKVGPMTWDNVNVAAPTVVFRDKKFYMWYSGLGTSGSWQIGYATSDIEKKFEQQAEKTEIDANPLPSKFQILENYPNPFNPSTRLRVGIPEPGKIRIDVYDVVGKLVSVLADETVEQGWHDLDWNGRTTSGVEAASGIYFARVEFIAQGKAAVSAVHKMSLMK